MKPLLLALIISTTVTAAQASSFVTLDGLNDAKIEMIGEPPREPKKPELNLGTLRNREVQEPASLITRKERQAMRLQTAEQRRAEMATAKRMADPEMQKGQ